MSLRRLVAVVAALPVLAFSAFAWADVAPQNSCNVAGQACTDALGPNGAYTASGVCVSTTCGHTTPLPDGGYSVTQNPCTLCMIGDGGTTSSSSSGSSSGGGTTDASPSGSSSGGSQPSGGGCAVGAVRAETLAPFALMAAGAAIVAVSRRRRSRR
jgi:hypothetical protein